MEAVAETQANATAATADAATPNDTPDPSIEVDCPWCLARAESPCTNGGYALAYPHRTRLLLWRTLNL